MSKRALSKSIIKSLYPSSIYRRGLSYFNDGRVTNLMYHTDTLSWKANVEGSETYSVTIREEKEGVFHTYCSCPAHQHYQECKHVVAVLLEINDQQQGAKTSKTPADFIRNWQYNIANDFIDTFAAYQNLAIDAKQHNAKNPMKVEYICKKLVLHHQGKEEALLTIEMKVGVERTYVVRNLPQFLEKVKKMTSHEFTKKFTYDPTEHYFLKEDEEAIAFLQEIANNAEIYYRTHAYGWQSYTNEREIIIPPLVAEPLLEKLKTRCFTYIHDDVSYKEVAFNDKELPFSFQLSKNNAEEFQIHLYELPEITYFPEYGWLFYDGVFYKPKDEQKPFVEGLISFQEVASERFLPIAKNQIEPFLSQVLPGLKKIGKVEIAENVSDQIMQPPLQAKLFIDQQEERLEVKVEYHYGDVMINPFNYEPPPLLSEQTILLRDAEKERQLMAAIESSPLKFNGKQLYLEADEAKLYDFLFHSLPAIEVHADIYMTNIVRTYLTSEQHEPITSVDVNSHNGLLEINFDIAGIEKSEIEEILKSVVEKKKYYRLQNGAFISLEKEAYQTLDTFIAEFALAPKELANDQVRLPVYRGLQLEEIIGKGDKYTTKFGKAYRHLLQHLKHPDEMEFTFPDNVQAVLREYQKTGFQWFKALSYYQLGGILADDMGLGKTLQSIAYLASEKEKTEEPFLIVAPASLVYNWESEFQKFAPSLKVRVVIGSPKERAALLQSNEMPDVWITSYPTLRQDIDMYEAFTFDTMIMDEAQAIKNHLTKTAGAVRRVRAQKRFALSGTPIENSLDELWAIFQTVLPGFFPNQQAFKKLSHKKIAKMIRPFILRRVKKDVLKELPDKIETKHLSELTRPQKELYLAYLEKIQQETVLSLQNEDFSRNRMKILAGLTRLRQLCCHPSLFVENYTGESGKLNQLMEITQNALENGKRLLIFSQFSSMLKIIRTTLEKEGISFFYLDGQTNAKERVEMSSCFNQGEKDVFLISLKAGGTGLNLTGADTVILYDLWWNPAVEEQAAGRAHRIGQKNVVQVIRLIAQGTIEEKIYALQQKKRALIEKVIQPGETMLTSLSEKEIREILDIS